MSDEPDRPTPQLELAKTRLTVEDGEIVRRGETGAVVTRIPLDDLEGAVFRKRFNPFVLAFLLMACGLAAVGYFVSEYNILTVFLYAAALMTALFGAFGMWADTLELKYGGGTLRVECPDPTDEVRGFAASLGRLVRRDE